MAGRRLGGGNLLPFQCIAGDGGGMGGCMARDCIGGGWSGKLVERPLASPPSSLNTDVAGQRCVVLCCDGWVLT